LIQRKHIDFKEKNGAAQNLRSRRLALPSQHLPGFPRQALARNAPGLGKLERLCTQTVENNVRKHSVQWLSV
jgi:hypothetical protein